MQLFWLSVGFGLVTASVLTIAAVGLSLQFGITNYVNFAYGDFMALGGFFAYVLNNQVLHLNIWIALVLGALAMGLLAVLINRFILGPFARRFTSGHYVLIVTFGLSLILLNVEYSIWGAQVRFFKMPISQALSIGPLRLTKNQLIVMAIAAVLMIAVHTMLKVTRLGKSMRAMSDNTTLAMTSGIDTKRITTITWFLSGSLAGVAGTVLGISEGNSDAGVRRALPVRDLRRRDRRRRRKHLRSDGRRSSDRAGDRDLGCVHQPVLQARHRLRDPDPHPADPPERAARAAGTT